MSLINDMLKDLQQRKPNKNQNAAEILSGIHSVSNSRPAGNLRLFFILAVLILAASSVYYFNKHRIGSKQANLQALKQEVDLLPQKVLPEQTQSSQQDVKTIPQIPAKQENIALAASAIPKPISPAVTEKPDNSSEFIKVDTPLTQKQRLALAYKAVLEEIKQANYIEAEKKLKPILKQNPRYRPALETYIALLLRRGDEARAGRWLKRAVSYYPNYSAFTKLQARVQLNHSDYQAALATLNSIKPEISEDPDYYGMLAGIYRHLNKPLQAISIYNQLVKVQPANGMWWLGLGISLEMAGKTNPALSAYRKAQEVPNLAPELASYLAERLDKLQG